MFVEIIDEDKRAAFEQRINGSIKCHEIKGYKVVDIKYCHTPETIVGYKYSAMIIYKESE